ncbi:MAG: hypothetical protein AB7O04_05395 [Hyphomonadaceae bacterium]
MMNAKHTAYHDDGPPPRKAHIWRLVLVGALAIAAFAAVGFEILFAGTALDPRIEAQPGFFAIFGATAAMTAAVIARVMRMLLIPRRRRTEEGRYHGVDRA